MSGLVWIQTVWHSDGIPEIIYDNVNFEKNQQKTFFFKKITQHARINKV